MPKPTIILVHGAWHRPDHYKPFLDVLERKGYPCIAPSLPSGSTPPPEDPPAADVRCIREAAVEVADQGRKIIAVAHSYGGIVATEAFAGLGVETRAKEGKKGGVRWLVYLTAYMVSGDDSLGSVLLPHPLTWLRVEGMEAVLAEDHDYGSVFYSDLPKAEHQKLKDLLRSFPIACAAYVPKAKAYLNIKTVYVYCENDLAVPLSVQRMLVDKVKELGVGVKEESLPAGHFPSLSMPGELARVIERLLEYRARI
ncbi:hypothetical protein CkaCkLH20_10472 [Colletotrichum karsti]|uniref:AB hydrolase-1 domain-containing protein n=1 Tax=Colletotrichum karsti TaxID=1095194 RepID=A0A9P6HXU6_9PEZI|nr:uncharacterized protein CkaCkLH20_10472 [Colletotrichum karsti]KAF9872135.1 hypothetical protein CkaCkLH20_10472 [Colletotrichum karsti]